MHISFRKGTAMKARVLIAVIVLCLNSVVAGQAMQRAENDPPVVVIRGKYYSLKDLVGFSRSEFSKSYAECASKLSDAALKEQILAYARGAESRRLIQDETDRASHKNCPEKGWVTMLGRHDTQLILCVSRSSCETEVNQVWKVWEAD